MSEPGSNLFENFRDLEQSPNYQFLTALVKLWQQVRQGMYKVHLGWIDWISFDFDQDPLAVAIMTADEALLTDVRELTLTIEVMAKMPTRKDGVVGIDPLYSAAMKADIRWVLARLIEARAPVSRQGETVTDNIVQRLVLNSGRAADVSDMPNKLQGVMFTVTVFI